MYVHTCAIRASIYCHITEVTRTSLDRQGCIYVCLYMPVGCMHVCMHAFMYVLKFGVFVSFLITKSDMSKDPTPTSVA